MYKYITNDTHTLTQKVPPRLNLAQDGVKRPILLQGKLAFAQMDLPGRCCSKHFPGAVGRFVAGDIRESPEKSLKCRVFFWSSLLFYMVIEFPQVLYRMAQQDSGCLNQTSRHLSRSLVGIHVPLQNKSLFRPGKKHGKNTLNVVLRILFIEMYLGSHAAEWVVSRGP